MQKLQRPGGGGGIKHFFIINPMAHKVRGKLNTIIKSIRTFFKQYPHINYDIHITRWERDALGVIRRFAMNADELLRIHVMGGSDTLFEAVNGIIGLPNTHLAVYPFGSENPFLKYFGVDKLHLFTSIRSQVFSAAIPIDALRCGHNYGITNGLVGLEAITNKSGMEMIERNAALPKDLAYFWAAFKKTFISKTISQNYNIKLDSEVLNDNYITMIIANGPCYGKNMKLAVEAHPNDGVLDIYLIKNLPRSKLFSVTQTGNYNKLHNQVLHYRGKKIVINSEKPICICVDGQVFYQNTIEYEVMPYAIDFVCPGGIDIDKLSRVYGRQRNTTRGG